MGPRRIAYLGLGNIGLPMAINLIEYIKLHKLPTLTVWNRSKAKYLDIPNSVGVDDARNVIEEGCNIVFTCFANDEVAKEVYDNMFEIFPYLKEDVEEEAVIFVDQSTLSPKTAGLLEEKAKRVGAMYLSAPVFGQPPAVVAKTVVLTVAGDPESVKVVLPILQSLGRAVIPLGPDVQQAAKAKLLVNMMLYESIQVFSEVYTFAEITGVPADKLHQIFQTVIPAPPLLNYSSRISKGDFDGSTGFKLDGGIKDVKHMLSLREGLERDVPLPVLERVLANLEKAKVLAGDKAGEMSVEALSVVARDDAGLKPFRS